MTMMVAKGNNGLGFGIQESATAKLTSVLLELTHAQPQFKLHVGYERHPVIRHGRILSYSNIIALLQVPFSLPKARGIWNICSER
jgi:hypothetical protein